MSWKMILIIFFHVLPFTIAPNRESNKNSFRLVAASNATDTQKMLRANLLGNLLLDRNTLWSFI